MTINSPMSAQRLCWVGRLLYLAPNCIMYILVSMHEAMTASEHSRCLASTRGNRAVLSASIKSTAFELPLHFYPLHQFPNMLIILLLFALFQTLRGVPLSYPTNPPDDFSTFCLRDTESHFGLRTEWDIIISCFATIFACTWSAIHPNIPAPTDCWWTRFKRQVMTTICALLAPELITFWALQQRIAAGKIMEEYNKEILKGT